MNPGPETGTPLRVVGAVLAGGRSSRMGRDKAAVEVGEASMLARGVAALRGSAFIQDVFVVSSRPDTPTGSWTVVPDVRPSAGPLAAIETALMHGRTRGAEGVFVLACDLPLVESRLIDDVIRAFGRGGAAAAARPGSPGFEPLCAVYRTESLDQARALLDEGERAAWRLFDTIGGTTVHVDHARLANVNTPADLERVREGRTAEDDARMGGDEA